MDRFTAYCDLPFLDAFARLRPPGDPGSSEALDRWGAVNAFLRRAAHVVVRVDPSETADDAALAALLMRHPLLRGMMDRPHGTSLRFDRRPFEQAERADHHANAPFPWRVYLVESAEDRPEDLSERFGTLFADAQGAIDAWARLGTAHVTGIGTDDPDRLRSWGDLDGRWAPSHDLVLSDRYLFADRRKARQNLIPLLLGLLPESADIPPAVVLVGRGRDAGEFGESAETARKWVLDEIERERPTLNLRLTVALLDWKGDVYSGLHDRRLFLRYGFVESGASVNNVFIDGAPACTTRLTFSPLFDPAVLSRTVAELRVLAHAIRVVERLHRGASVVAGPRSHPLLPK